MTISVITVIGLLSLHFLADFILQSDEMARGKSTSNKWLGLHVLVYTIIFMIVGPTYAILNGVLHFITDWFTSRLSAKMWKAERVHDFFVVIGGDQLIHTITLILTYIWIA